MLPIHLQVGVDSFTRAWLPTSDHTLEAFPLPEAPAVSCAMIQCVGTLAGPTAGHDVAGDYTMQA